MNCADFGGKRSREILAKFQASAVSLEQLLKGGESHKIFQQAVWNSLSHSAGL